MLARLRFTVVDIDFAIAPSHAVDADARVIGNAVDACGAGRARIAQAFVDVVAAVFAIVAGRTQALEVVHLVDAGGIIFARMTQALVDIQIAQCARVARFAVAFECARLIDANAVPTNGRRCLAFIDVDFAIRPIPAARALAIVFVGTAIVTRRSILARS